MTDRNLAKELRAYDVAPTLRLWHGGLWDLRMVEFSALDPPAHLAEHGRYRS